MNFETKSTSSIDSQSESTNNNSKPSEPLLPAPYTIQVIPTDQETNIPETIDVMSILYSTDKSKSAKSISQQYLPKKLKKEVTDEEIEEIYSNMQIIKIKRKKDKFISLQNKEPKPFETIMNESNYNSNVANINGSDKNETKNSNHNKK